MVPEAFVSFHNGVVTLSARAITSLVLPPSEQRRMISYVPPGRCSGFLDPSFAPKCNNPDASKLSSTKPTRSPYLLDDDVKQDWWNTTSAGHHWSFRINLIACRIPVRVRVCAADSRTSTTLFWWRTLLVAVCLTESEASLRLGWTTTLGRRCLCCISNSWPRVKIWSMQPGFGRNPASCSRMSLSQISVRRRE